MAPMSEREVEFGFVKLFCIFIKKNKSYYNNVANT